MGKPIRVLMVEDSENDAKLELHQLRKNGYEPEHDRVETAEAMLTALREKAWEVILCDYQMPQFSGPEAIALLKETGIDIPLIIVSGAIGEGTAVEALKAGAHDYIMKGNLTRLVPAIVRELEEAESRRKRKQAETALAESEWKYRILAENTSDWEFWVDPQFRFLYCSPSCLQVTGHEAAEFMADPTLLDRIIHPDDRANHAAHTRDVQSKSQLEEIIFRIIRPDGAERWIGHVCQSVTDKEGLFMGRRGSNRDITERKQAEEKLRYSELLFQTTINSLTGHICVLDETGKIVMTNQAWDDFAIANSADPQCVSEYVNYLSVCDSVTGPDFESASSCSRGIRGVLSGDSPEFSMEYPCHSPTEKRWFLGRVSPLQRKDSRWVVINHENITERKLAEEAICEEAKRLDSVLSATGTGIDIIDGDFNLHFVDRSWQKVYGNPTGRKCYEYFNGLSEPCPGCCIPKTLETKQTVISYEVLPRENNRPIEVRTIPFQDDEGQWLVAEVNIDITVRKQAEEMLRESEKRFLDVFYASGDAILLIGDNKFVNCNEATARMLGYATREEFLQTHPSALSPPEQPDGRESFEKAEEMMRLAIARGFHRFEWIHRRANGDDFPVEVSLTPIVHQGNSLLYCVWRDITEVKRTEENLQRVREQLDLAVHGANDGIWDWNLRTQELYMSPKWKEQLGYADEELPNVFSTFEELLCPEDKPEVLKFVDRYLKGEIPHYALEFRMRHKDGAFHWILARGAALRGPDGVPYRMAGSHTDITERKQAGEALIKSEERFRLLFDKSQDALMTLAPPSWRFISANPSTLALFGMDCLDEFLALGLWDVSPELQPDGRTSPEKAKEMIEAAMRDGSSSFDWIHKKIDGPSFPSTVLLTRIALDNQVFLQATVRDVSKQIALETELSHARKLEAVGQLAAGIAHEINTPTQFISDSIHFLREACDSQQELIGQYRLLVDAIGRQSGHEQLLAQIRDAEEKADIDYLKEHVPGSFDRCFDGLGRIAAIVGAMKEFAHPDQKEKSSADLNQALQATLTIARNEYKYVADVETELGELPPVVCHVGELNQVFLNLLVNAAHAIADVVGDTGERGKIRVRTRTEGEHVIVEIEDTGTGIPERIRERVFEPFFTTKGVGKGSGQGLAITHSVVANKHGGTLTFRTQEGQGTTFIIRIPVDGIIGKVGRA